MVTRDPGVADAAGMAAQALLDDACGRVTAKRSRRSALQGDAAALARETLSPVE
jgi:hypothetical protein